MVIISAIENGKSEYCVSRNKLCEPNSDRQRAVAALAQRLKTFSRHPTLLCTHARLPRCNGIYEEKKCVFRFLIEVHLPI